MSRSTTYLGLTNEAKEFIKNNSEVIELKFNNGFGENTIYLPKTENIGKCGMFDDYDIVKYKLLNGTYAEEFIQYEQWYSGPIIFIGLKYNDKEFLWSQNEIDSYIS